MQKYNLHKEPLHLLRVSTILATKVGVYWKKNVLHKMVSSTTIFKSFTSPLLKFLNSRKNFSHVNMSSPLHIV